MRCNRKSLYSPLLLRGVVFAVFLFRSVCVCCLPVLLCTGLVSAGVLPPGCCPLFFVRKGSGRAPAL